MDEHYDYLSKVILLGDFSVGKSTFMSKLIYKQNESNTDQIIKIGFCTKTIKNQRNIMKFQIWDPCSQQKYFAVTPTYYKNALGVILFYDITVRKSFQHIKYWLDQIYKYGHQQVVIFLAGNKNDLQTQRKVTFQEGKQIAQEYSLLFLEINYNQKEKTQFIFKSLATKIIEIKKRSQARAKQRNFFVNPLVFKKWQERKSCC